jgi:hypothetical protein
MASRKLKVYGWSSFRNGKQTREVMAATSMTAVINAHKHSKPSRAYMGETGNRAEVEAAMSKPGAIFYRPITDRNAPYVEATA